jgi:hypothetical protein
MAYGRIDINDAVVSPFFVLASGVAAGLFELSLFGYDFSQALWTGSGGASLSIANTVAIVALLVALLSNMNEHRGSGNPLSQLDGIELWVAIATVGLVIAPPFVPTLEATLGSSQMIGLIAVVIQAGGFYSLSYLG